ncbi:MAG: AmmeMemoRadiSam system radical SAM enzyme [Planctomycetota bacterium]
MSRRTVGSFVVGVCVALILGMGGYRAAGAFKRPPRGAVKPPVAAPVPPPAVPVAAAPAAIVFMDTPPGSFAGLIPDGMRLEQRETPFRHYALYDAASKRVGTAVETCACAPDAGAAFTYTGTPLNLAVVIDAENKVVAVRLTASSEDEEFLRMVDDGGLYTRLAGAAGDAILGVDAVSGATMSSTAIMAAVHAAWKAVSGLTAGETAQVPPPPVDQPATPPAVEPALPRLDLEPVKGIGEATIKGQGLSLEAARWWEPRGNGKVQCLLCPFNCLLSNGDRGRCRARANIKGELKTIVYSRVLARHVDPIEKKPLYHFLPGSRAYSVATAGCNLRCVFCQNYDLSQLYPENASYNDGPAGEGVIHTPAETVAAAKEAGAATIAYTYSEPAIFYEYMIDTARLARAAGIRNVWVTAGYINPEPLKELCKVIDAANVDLKGFSEEFYAKYCTARLAPVLETLKTVKAAGVWLEITNLIVPGGNDDMAMIQSMCEWIVQNLGPDVPLHFSRFHGAYKMASAAPTPEATLTQAADIAKKAGIRFVYVGNLPTSGQWDNTVCPACGKVVIERQGFYIKANHVRDGKCEFCGETLNGVWR